MSTITSTTLPPEILALATLAADDGSHTTATKMAYDHTFKVLLGITDPDTHAITYAIDQAGIDFDFNQIFLHSEEQLIDLKYKDPTASAKSSAVNLLQGHVTKLIMLRKFFFFIYRVHGSYPTPFQWTQVDKGT